MITRRGRKKNCTPISQVTTPLSSLNAKKAKMNNTSETKKLTVSPIVEESNESNAQNGQSPVFNIHVHMPTIPSDLNESCHVQPVIHLHFGDMISRLTPGSTSQNAGTVKSFKVESLSELSNNFEEPNNSHDEIVALPSENNVTCKKTLIFNNLNKNNEDLKTEEPKLTLVSSDNIKGNESSKKSVLRKSKSPVKKTAKAKRKRVLQKENGDFKSNMVFDSECPLRRSTRVANNLKLLETIKAINQSKSGKNKSKKVKDNTKSGHILNPFTLKEPVVVLCDKCRVHENDKKENITDCNSTTSVSVDNEANTSLASENACEKNYSGLVSESHSSSVDTEIYSIKCSGIDEGSTNENEIQNEGLSYESSTDVDDTENLNIALNCEASKTESIEKERKETLINESSSENEEKTEIKETSSDESLLSLGRKSGEIYSAIYTSDNEETCAENNSSDVEDNRVNYTSAAYSVKNFTSENQGQGKENIQPNENAIINETDNDALNAPSNNADQILNVERRTEGDEENYSNSSSISGNLGTDLDEVDSDMSDKADAEDGEQTPMMELDLDNTLLENVNNNTLKNVEVECLSKSDDDEEKSVSIPDFQLELIKKEMKTRKMTYQERSSKSAAKKKKLSQVSKRAPDNSPVAKKIKLTNEGKVSVKKTTEKNIKESPGDYIPLQASGPTKFAVAQLNCIKPREHKAKNFKAEMLFGKRVARFSDNKHLQTYRLKKQAAEKRKKFPNRKNC